MRVDEGDAGVDVVERRVRGPGQDQVLRVEVADERRDLARPCRRAAATVEKVPAEDGGVVLVGDTRVGIDVLEEPPDVPLDVGDRGPIRPEGLHVAQAASGVGDSFPAQVHASGAACTCIVADDRGDDPNSAVAR